jgi:O-antigen/teichoic acid export membrane protein
MSIRPMIQNGLWLLVAQLVSKAVMFVATILVARHFGLELFGKFSFALAFATVFLFVANFGLAEFMIREVARFKDRTAEYFGNALSLKFFSTLLTLGISYAILSLLGKDTETQILVYLLILYTIFFSAVNFTSSIFRAFEKMQYEAYVQIIGSLLLLILGISALFFHLNLELFISAFPISYILAFIVSLLFLHQIFCGITLKFNWSVARHVLSESWPFALSSFFTLLYFQLDTVMVSLFKGDQAAGIYNAAYNFIFAALLIPNIVGSVLYPRLSACTDDKKYCARIQNRVLFLLFITAIGITVVTFFGSTFWLRLLYGSEFLSASALLRLLSLTFPLLFVCSFYGIVLASVNKQKIGMYVTGGTAVLNMILNYFFIQRWSYYGAAFASLISFFVMFLLLTYYYCRYHYRCKTVSYAQ